MQEKTSRMEKEMQEMAFMLKELNAAENQRKVSSEKITKYTPDFDKDRKFQNLSISNNKQRNSRNQRNSAAKPVQNKSHNDSKIDKFIEKSSENIRKTNGENNMRLTSVSSNEKTSESDVEIIEPVGYRSNRRSQARERRSQIIPSKSTKNTVQKIQNAKRSKSIWYKGSERENWQRPCFKGYDTVVMGDSQLKIYGKQNKKKPGFNIASYSGADVS